VKTSKQPSADLGIIFSFCGARTKHGTACDNKPEPGKRRCRLHGGAPGSGAPKGNQNAKKHGLYSKEMKEVRQIFNDLMKGSKEFSRNRILF
jgi:hypothetical protein